MAQTMAVNDWRYSYAIGLLLVVAVAAAGWYGYSYYTATKEQAAYKDLSELIDGYVKAHSLDTGSSKME